MMIFMYIRAACAREESDVAPEEEAHSERGGVLHDGDDQAAQVPERLHPRWRVG